MRRLDSQVPASSHISTPLSITTNGCWYPVPLLWKERLLNTLDDWRRIRSVGLCSGSGVKMAESRILRSACQCKPLIGSVGAAGGCVLTKSHSCSAHAHRKSKIPSKLKHRPLVWHGKKKKIFFFLMKENERSDPKGAPENSWKSVM